MAEKMEIVPKEGLKAAKLEERLAEMFCAMGLNGNITVRSCPETGNIVVSNLASWGNMLKLFSEVLEMTGNVYFVKGEKSKTEKAILAEL